MIALLLLTMGLADSPQDTLSPAARAELRVSFQDFTIPPDAPAVLHTTLGGTATRNVVAGDVITAIGDKHIGNLYDMTNALRSHQPGDSVVVVSRRDGVERRATAVLGKRT